MALFPVHSAHCAAFGGDPISPMPTITPPKKLKQSRAQSTVTFSAEEASKAEAKAVEKLGERIRIEGFRPGRAPADLLRQKINPEQLSEETIRSLLPDVFDALIKEHKLQPIIPPRVDLISRSPLTLEITIVERPEVKVKGASKITAKKNEPTVDEKSIDRMVDYLRGQYRVTSPVDRPAQDKDEVTLDFAGTLDGKPVDGAKATGYKLVLGSSSLIPGFEDAVVGLKKGDEKSFTVTFPSDYHAEHLKGKPVTFAVTIHNIHEVTMPEFTDAFVKEHHLGESTKDLRDRIGKSLREQEEQAEKTRREKDLFDAIRSATVIDLAPELTAHEERGIAEEIMRNLERDKTPIDVWLKQTNRTPEKFQKEIQEEAAKRLTLRFAIQWLLDDQKIEMSTDDLAAALLETLNNIPEDQRKDAEAYYKEGGEGYEELKWRKRVEKLVEKMLAQ